jgi:hypothetical protein
MEIWDMELGVLYTIAKYHRRKGEGVVILVFFLHSN